MFREALRLGLAGLAAGGCAAGGADDPGASFDRNHGAANKITSRPALSSAPITSARDGVFAGAECAFSWRAGSGRTVARGSRRGFFSIVFAGEGATTGGGEGAGGGTGAGSGAPVRLHPIL